MPFLSRLGSIGAFLASEKEDFRPGSQTLVDWIPRFDAWYRDSTGISQGRNLHLLYGRECRLAVDSLAGLEKRLFAIACAARKRGFITNLELDLWDLLEVGDTLIDTFQAERGFSLTLDCRKPNRPTGTESGLLRTLEAAAEATSMLTLRGDPLWWLEKGVGRSQTLGGKVFRVVPDSGGSITGPSERHISACDRRLQMTIDENGEIFPCVGLIGFQQFRLGSIHEELPKASPDFQELLGEVEKLGIQGPAVPPDLTVVTKEPGFPVVCCIHRNILRAEGASTRA